MRRIVFNSRNRMIFIDYDIEQKRPFVEAEQNLLYNSILTVMDFTPPPRTKRFNLAITEMIERNCELDFMESDMVPYHIKMERPLLETWPKNLYTASRIEKDSASRMAREELVLRN